MSKQLIYLMLILVFLVVVGFALRGSGVLTSITSLSFLDRFRSGTTIQDSNGEVVLAEEGQATAAERLVLERELPSGVAQAAPVPTAEPTALPPVIITDTPVPTDPPAATAAPAPTAVVVVEPVPTIPTATPVPAVPATSTPPPIASVPPFITFIDHTVQDGETVAAISRIHTTDVNLMEHYGIYQNLIYPGQILRIPVFNAGACNGQIHVVATGQNVFRIGREYGKTQEAIRDMNGLSGDYLIKVGQPLCIPN